jgi:hypothetical protein
MKITKRDVKIINVLHQLNVNVDIVEDDHNLEVYLDDKGVWEVRCNDYGVHDFTDLVLAGLKAATPPAGTPNSELTDEQKGLIQLLFEVEKAIA